MLARSASSVKSSTARSSMAGVRYSTGIDDSGGRTALYFQDFYVRVSCF